MKSSCSEKLDGSTLVRSYFSSWLMKKKKHGRMARSTVGCLQRLNAGLLVSSKCLLTASRPFGHSYLRHFSSYFVYFSFYILSLENHLHFLSFIPSFPVAAKPRGLSGAACAPGGGGTCFGCPGRTAATGGGDHP